MLHTDYDSDNYTSSYSTTKSEMLRPPLYCTPSEDLFVFGHHQEAVSSSSPKVFTELNDVDTNLKKFELDTACLICNVVHSTIQNARDHYLGKKHKKNVAQWLRESNSWQKCEVSQQDQPVLTRPVLRPTTTTLPTSSNSTEKKFEQMLSDRLKTLILPNFCGICPATLLQPAVARSHYNGQRHQNKLEIWKSTELQKIMGQKCITTNTPSGSTAMVKYNKRDEIEKQNETSKQSAAKALEEEKLKIISERILNKKLDLLLLFDSCGICPATLQQPSVAMSHYNGTGHKNKLEMWKKTELQNIMSKILKNTNTTNGLVATEKIYTQENTILKNEASKQPVAKNSKEDELQIVSEHIFNKKLNDLTLSYFCGICSVILINPSVDKILHYNGKKHKKKLEQWKKTELQKLTNTGVPNESVATGTNNKQSHSVESNEASEHFVEISSEREKSKNLFEQIINEKLKDLELPSFCSICQATLTQLTCAGSHYNGKGHKKKLDAWKNAELEKMMSQNLGNTNSSNGSAAVIQTNKKKRDRKKSKTVSSSVSTTQVRSFCNVCGISVTRNMELHLSSLLHKQNADKPKDRSCCSLCNFETMSKNQMSNHLKGSEHKENLVAFHKKKSLNNFQIPQTIVTPFSNPAKNKSAKTNAIQFGYPEKSDASEITCTFCDIKFQNANVIKDHFQTDWHKKKVMEKAPNSLKVLPKVKNDTTNQDRASSVSSTVFDNLGYYCYLCNVLCDNKQKLYTHISTFPHCQLQRLKSDLIANGIVNEFWFVGKDIRCIICSATLQTDSSAVSHFNSKKHTEKLMCWCQDQPTNFEDKLNRRWYYCDVCCLYLDGTTNAELHYQEYLHKHKQQEKDAKSSKLSISTSPWMDDQNSSTDHQFSGEPKIMIDGIIKKNYAFNNDIFTKNEKQSSSTQTELSSTPNLAGQTTEDEMSTKKDLLEEVRKLTEIIYFSKTIPAGTALHYLKNFNCELESLAKLQTK